MSRETLEARIKSLTTIIHILQPQNGKPTPGNARSANARAYGHVATLLTRGVEDRGAIAVTGALAATGAVVTALTSHPGPHISPHGPTLSPIDTGPLASTSDHAPSSSPPLDKDLAKVHMAVTQNFTPSTTFHGTRVEPNPSMLSDICETLNVTESVTLSQHAADVLKALNSTRGHPVASSAYQDLFLLSMELVHRRCFPKIKHRVSGIKHLFLDHWIPSLESWEPQPTDTLNFALIEQSRLLLSSAPAEEIWVKVPMVLHRIFNFFRIPQQLRDNVTYHQFQASTWLKCLVSVFRSLQRSVQNFQDGRGGPFLDLDMAIIALYSFVYDLREFFDAIFQMPSLILLLNSLRQRPTPTQFQGSAGLQPVQTEAMQTEEPDFQAEFAQEPDEDNGRLLLRYLKTIVAWMHALMSLNRSKLFRSGLDITLNIVHYPRAPKACKMLPVGELLDELVPRVAPNAELCDAVKTKLRPMVKLASETFAGAVHCEAMLMGLTTACTERPTNPCLTPEFVELFKDSNRVIGVGKKCCWTCNFLAKKLATPQSHFQLPGTTGIIFPWAPPFGIPFRVLQDVNNELEHILTTILRDFVNLHKFSPSSSDDWHAEHQPLDSMQLDFDEGWVESFAEN